MTHVFNLRVGVFLRGVHIVYRIITIKE